ncbi:hypothetical protein [Caproiciproducens sp.]|uniref:hypothetical protein n=1 Tax=Caproiciproducens sp. TaxID=1954376 RepID=UPI0028997A2D|nr:hypothetical protein [Caproiciproducens sp.]
MKNSKCGKSKFMAATAIIGMISAVAMVVTSVLSSYLVMKLFRYIHTAQKALPEMEKAARLYQKKNSVTDTESKTKDE